MDEQYWMDLLEETPAAVQTCARYFQERYLGNWQSRLLDAGAVLGFLQRHELEVTVATFGIPNRRDWYYEIVFRGELLRHERHFQTYELAAESAIRAAFRQLEVSLR